MNKNLFLLALGALTLTACTSEDVIDVSPSQGNAISFENLVNKNTRAGIEGDLTGKDFDNFLVYGYYTKEGMVAPIQIFNGVSVKKGTNSETHQVEWTYDGVRYWIPKCTYYFYAYSCGDIALTSGKGSPAMTLTNASSEDERALAITSYLCDGTHQHDLVTAENEKIVAKDNNNDQVSLKFGHALCKVKAVFTTDFPADYTIKVSNVKIDEFYNLGDFNVGTNVWSNFGTTGVPYINLNVDVTKNTMTNAVGSSVETSEAFLIPNKYEANRNVKIHFTIDVTKEGNSVLQRNITGTWSPQWEKGHIYRYNINISGSSAGIEPIVFAASQELSGSEWGNEAEVDMVFGVDTSSGSN